MANVAVYNMEGKEVGTMELNDAVFRRRCKRASGSYGSRCTACKQETGNPEGKDPF